MTRHPERVDQLVAEIAAMVATEHRDDGDVPVGYGAMEVLDATKYVDADFACFGCGDVDRRRVRWCDPCMLRVVDNRFLRRYGEVAAKLRVESAMLRRRIERQERESAALRAEIVRLTRRGARLRLPAIAHDHRYHDELVYAIEWKGYIKIGFSTCPWERLRRVAGPGGRVVWTAPGGAKLEHELHKRFDDLRLRVGPAAGLDGNSEWFEPGDDLLAFLRMRDPLADRPRDKRELRSRQLRESDEVWQSVGGMPGDRV